MDEILNSTYRYIDMENEKEHDYIYVQNPLKKDEKIKAEVVDYDPKNHIDTRDFKLEDGNKLRVSFTVTAVAKPIDNNGKYLIDPLTNKPYYTINYQISLTTIFKE